MQYTEHDLEKIIEKLAQSTQSPKDEYTAYKSIRRLEKRIAMKRMRKNLYIAGSAAAAILLCIFSWSIYNLNQPSKTLTVSTLAEIKSIQLSDGTYITLNHYSSISFPKKFKNKNREIQLEGEAYFDVRKDKNHPFIVQTGNIYVEVLGTQFNVEAYSNDEIIKTSLYEGSVAINNIANQNKLVLEPNETAIYNKIEREIIKTKSPDITDDIAWKNGAFIFSNKPLREIVRELSNSFGIEIIIVDSILREYKMTARFTNKESLEEILSLLQPVGNFKYTINNQTITITK